MELQIGPMCQGSRLIKPNDAKVAISDGSSDMDVGLICLFDQSAILELSAHKVFLRMGDLDLRELRGISGCGMWSLVADSRQRNQLDQWDTSWIRLLGIEYAWVRRKWVKCVFVPHAIDLILKFIRPRASVQVTMVL